MGRKLTNYTESEVIPMKNAIHDCVDTGSDLAITASQEILLPIDCGVRDYKSTTQSLWDSANSKIIDTIDDTALFVKFKLELNGAVNDICAVRIYVDHPTFGEIDVDYQEFVLYKNNIDTLFTGFSLLYNGVDSEAKQYGFKVAITPTGNMTLKQRSILIAV